MGDDQKRSIKNRCASLFKHLLFREVFLKSGAKPAHLKIAQSLSILYDYFICLIHLNESFVHLLLFRQD